MIFYKQKNPPTIDNLMTTKKHIFTTLYGLNKIRDNLLKANLLDQMCIVSTEYRKKTLKYSLFKKTIKVSLVCYNILFSFKVGTYVFKMRMQSRRISKEIKS